MWVFCCWQRGIYRTIYVLNAAVNGCQRLITFALKMWGFCSLFIFFAAGFLLLLLLLLLACCIWHGGKNVESKSSWQARLVIYGLSSDNNNNNSNTKLTEKWPKIVTAATAAANWVKQSPNKNHLQQTGAASYSAPFLCPLSLPPLLLPSSAPCSLSPSTAALGSWLPLSRLLCLSLHYFGC